MLNHEDQIQTHMKFRVFQSWDQSFTKFKKINEYHSCYMNGGIWHGGNNTWATG
jgi:hypothetical protein